MPNLHTYIHTYIHTTQRREERRGEERRGEGRRVPTYSTYRSYINKNTFNYDTHSHLSPSPYRGDYYRHIYIYIYIYSHLQISGLLGNSVWGYLSMYISTYVSI